MSNDGLSVGTNLPDPLDDIGLPTDINSFHLVETDLPSAEPNRQDLETLQSGLEASGTEIPFFRERKNGFSDCIANPGLFFRTNQPLVLPGRDDITPFRASSGLTGCRYTVTDFTVKLHRRTAMDCQAHSLAGHDGGWESLRDTTPDQWIAQNEDIVLSCNKPPIVMGYSTGGLTYMRIEQRNPGSIRGMILIDVPLYTPDPDLEALTDWAIENGACDPKNDLYYLSFPTIEFDGERTLQEKKTPGYKETPLPNVAGLRMLQLDVREDLSKIKCPVIYLQGLRDPCVDDSVPDVLQGGLGSELKVIPPLLKNSNHASHIGHDRKLVSKLIWSFNRQVLGDELYRHVRDPGRLAYDWQIQRNMREFRRQLKQAA